MILSAGNLVANKKYIVSKSQWKDKLLRVGSPWSENKQRTFKTKSKVQNNYQEFWTNIPNAKFKSRAIYSLL